MVGAGLGMVLVTAAYLLLAAVDLPGLHKRPECRGEFWAAAALFGVGLAMVLMFALGFSPPSLWEGMQALFRPVGTILFTAPGL